MLTRITDLFVGGAPRYSEDQIGVFDDVMVRLMSTIEAKARAKLANRLAPIANAPASVVHMLAFDDNIEVARPVLRQRCGCACCFLFSVLLSEDRGAQTSMSS